MSKGGGHCFREIFLKICFECFINFCININLIHFIKYIFLYRYHRRRGGQGCLQRMRESPLRSSWKSKMINIRLYQLLCKILAKVGINHHSKSQEFVLTSELEDENRTLKRMRECKICLSAEVPKFHSTFTFHNSIPCLITSYFPQCSYFHLLGWSCLSSLWPPCHLCVLRSHPHQLPSL